MYGEIGSNSKTPAGRRGLLKLSERKQLVDESCAPMQAQVLQVQRGWWGGNTGPVWPPIKRVFNGASSTGMTALSWMYERNVGFVLAADGKSEFVAETAEEESDLPAASTTEQKLFLVRFKRREIAYAFTGLVCNQNRTFNLMSETQIAFEAMSGTNPQNLGECVDILSQKLKRAFDKAKQDGRIKTYTSNAHCPDPSESNVVARILFASYFRPLIPSIAILKLTRTDQVLDRPEVSTETPRPKSYFVGAWEIAKLTVEPGENWVKEYVKTLSATPSLEELASQARGFIEACSDPRAVAVDSSCRGIGGHIHIAAITPREGFKWLVPPKV